MRLGRTGMLLVWMVLAMAGLGCGDDSGSADSDAGDGDSGDGDSGDGDSGDGDGAPVELIPCTGSVCFQDVYDALLHNTAAYGCDDAFCHGRGAGDLWMIDKQSTYEALVTIAAAGAAPGPNTSACSDSGLVRVVPGDADASLLLQKVAEMTPDCGDPMPPNPDMAVSDEHVTLLRTWIDEGAGYE